MRGLASFNRLNRDHGHIGVPVSAGELASRWNQIYPSLLSTYEKLKKLGFTYSDGKVFPPILAEKEGTDV